MTDQEVTRADWNTYRHLLAAVLADPLDDLPRLACADWLLEYGDESELLHAEFIRLQINGAGTPETISRIMQITASWKSRWLAGSLPSDAFILPRDYCQKTGSLIVALKPKNDIGILNLFWHRGFIAGVSCLYLDWLKFGPLLVTEHPIEFVHLIDRGYGKMPDAVRSWYNGKIVWLFADLDQNAL